MTIREIYKNSEQFLNKEVKLGRMDSQHPGFKTFWISCAS